MPPVPFPIPNIPQISSYLGRGGVPGLPFDVPGVGAASAFLGAPVARAVNPSFLSKVPGLGSAAESFAGMSPKVQGLGYGIAGELGGLGIRKLIPGSSKTEQVLSGAARGAGVGAGLGLLGGPFAELTSPAGAAIGGVLGGLGGAIFGGHKKAAAPKPEDQLAQAFLQSGIDQSTQDQLSHYYSVLNTLGGNTKESRAQALNTVGQLILKEMNTPATASAPAAWTPEQNAAVQLQTSQFLAPYLKQTLDTASESARVTLAQLANVPEQYRGVMAAGASQQLAATTRLANAYAAQAQLAPQAQAIQNQQQQQQALAAQLQQQAIAAQLSGSVGTGATNPYASLPTG